MKKLNFTLLIAFLFIFSSLPLFSQIKEITTSFENAQTNQSIIKTETINADEPLFEVKNDFGQTVFAVYSNGVKIFIDDQLKAAGGGFTVGRLGTGKSVSEDFFQVNPGNVRVNIYDTENTLKAAGGGFTVGRLGTGKSTTEDFLSVGAGKVRVNISDNSNTGGFSVGRLGSGQVIGDDYEFLSVTPDSTRISISEAGAVSNNGGFAINKIKADGYAREKFFKLNDNNIAIGHRSGISISTGLYNAFIGYESGTVNSIGEYNTFLGYQTGFANLSGNKNVFIGGNAGHSNVSGQLNTFIGSMAGYANLESSNNTYVGYGSGALGVSGTNRAFFGNGSGNNSTGDDNTYIGAEAGFYSESGSKNLYLGKGAGKSANGSGNVLIGFNAGEGFKGSNALYIDNSSTTKPLIYGEFNSDLLQLNGKVGVRRRPLINQLELEGNASKTVAGSWLANSDRRIKTQITDISNASDIIMRLHPVKFKYSEEWKKQHPSIEDKFYYNFIAQEYGEIFPESVKGSGEYMENDNKEILQIDTYNSQIISVKALQELILQNQKQQAEIDNLKAKISTLDTDKNNLEEKYQEMEANINKLSSDLEIMKSLLLQSEK